MFGLDLAATLDVPDGTLLTTASPDGAAMLKLPDGRVLGFGVQWERRNGNDDPTELTVDEAAVAGVRLLGIARATVTLDAE